jgi:hypothetical protein
MNTTTVEMAPGGDHPRYHELPPFARFQRRVWSVQDLVSSDPGRLGPPISGETAGLAVRYAEAMGRELPIKDVHVRSNGEGSLNLEWGVISVKVWVDDTGDHVRIGPNTFYGTAPGEP